MTSRKEIRRSAQRLFKVCLLDGRMSDDRVRVLVSELAERKPRGWRSLLSAVSSLVRQEVARRSAVVESAEELTLEFRERVVSELHRAHGNDVSVEFRAAPELLGGSRIRVGSDVWDGSVRSRLDRLKASFS